MLEYIFKLHQAARTVWIYAYTYKMFESVHLQIVGEETGEKKRLFFELRN